MIKSGLRSRLTEDICVVAEPENHGFSYIFDCGTASNLSIHDVMRTKAVFISHTHADHFANFDFVLRNRAGSRESVIVVGPENISRNVQAKFQSYTWNLIGNSRNYFEIREIKSDDEYEVYRIYPPRWDLKFISKVKSPLVFEKNGIYARYCILDHKIPSIAYVLGEEEHVNLVGEMPYKPGPWVGQLKKSFQEGLGENELQLPDKTVIPAQELFHLLKRTPGYQVGYVMDHLGGGYCHEKLRGFLKGIDELYIEAFFRDVDKDFAMRHFHSTAFLSGALARDAEVQILHLVHHSRRYLGELQDLIEEGRAAFEGREPQFKLAPQARFMTENSDGDI
jgi:ribonuclease Z